MRAAEIAKALGGRKASNGWSARCPAHDDHKPSLSITDGARGKVLFHCFAGCPQSAVLSALKSRGLWGKNDNISFPCPAPRVAAKENRARDQLKRIEGALAIWHGATTASGTLLEKYLASRGLLLTPATALRFHPHIKHISGHYCPAMIALVTRGLDETPLGIHRTFLARDGHGKAPISPAKMMLGPCRGGVVRLGQPGNILMIGEGIETCLAAMQATSKPAWAALSTSGMRTLQLPPEVRDVAILADGDDAGDAAAAESARRWQREGRRVRIARPPRGLDFNDLLMASSGRFGEAP